jgi:hypothetical protein
MAQSMLFKLDQRIMKNSHLVLIKANFAYRRSLCTRKLEEKKY